MTNLTDYFKTDDVDNFTAAMYNAMLSSLIRAELSNTQALAANKTLVDADFPVQAFTPNANLDVILPVVSAANHPFFLINASVTYSLSVKNSGGTLIATLAASSAGSFVSNGAAWYLFGAVNGNADTLDGLHSTSFAQVSTITPNSGWVDESVSWAYSSADGATGIANVTGDATGRLAKGMRLAYTQAQILTAYWNMDASSNSQVGTYNGTDTSMTYTAGRFSNAATFNGTSSKIQITDNANLKPTGDFTIGLWFKSGVAGTAKELFQTYSQNTAVAGIHIQINTTNTITVQMGKNTGGSLSVDYFPTVGTTTVTDNAWHYLVVTWKANYLQIYLDGRIEATNYVPAPVYAATNYVRVGCRCNAGTDDTFMNGQIDDLFLVNGYALGESNIKSLYLAGAAIGVSSINLIKYALITNVGSYSGGVTPVTFWGGSDYALSNAGMTSVKYSTVKAPVNFPMSPAKWSIQVTDIADRTQASPVTNTYYNVGGITIVLPIGLWDVGFQVAIGATAPASASTDNVYASLSTSTTADTDRRFLGEIHFGGIVGTIVILGMVTKRVLVNLTAKTTYYLLLRCSQPTASITAWGFSVCPIEINAISAYL